jgi:hypothetical protein
VRRCEHSKHDTRQKPRATGRPADLALLAFRLLPYDYAVKWTCIPISSWGGARLQSLNPDTSSDSERGRRTATAWQPQQQQETARRRPSHH